MSIVRLSMALPSTVKHDYLDILQAIRGLEALTTMMEDISEQ